MAGRAASTSDNGYDRPGSDYISSPSSSVSDCIYSCLNDSICTAWTFDTTDSRCYMKTGSPGQSPKSQDISGLISNRASYEI